MIVLDEQIHGPSIAGPIDSWYPGRVISVKVLRSGTLIKDDAIPALLRAAPQPTFVTINVSDFWRKLAADSHYCAICISLSAEQVLELPSLLRSLFRLPEFKTKQARMGKVARVRRERIEYYEADWHIHAVIWPKRE